MPSAIPCSLSPLISRIHSSLFSDWRPTVPSNFFDTQVLSISTEELVLPCHARCVLSRVRCNGHSLLLSSYLSRIGRIENASCSACRLYATRSFATFCLYGLWSRPWRVSRLLGLHIFSPCPHPSEGVE